MFLSQKFCLQMVLVPLPSQATSREIYGACLLCVCLSSLDLGQLFLKLDLVISLTSTGISPQDVKADALARLVHLSAKRRESPRAQRVNVKAGNLSTLGYLDDGTGAQFVAWCFVSSPKICVGISWEGRTFSGISAGVGSLWSSPRKSWSQSLKKTKTICLKEQIF